MSDYKSYDEVKKEVSTFYNQKKYREAITLLESVLNQFPEEIHSTVYDLSILYIKEGRHERSMGILEYGLRKGIIYSFWEGADLWKPLQNLERFKKIVKENNRLRKEASAKARPKVEVVVPTCESEGYPLFIALHGWNDDIATLKQYWKSETIEKEYITAFVQSSQVVSTHKFGWDDYELGKKEVVDMYNNIVQEYPVDTKRVIIGGFSQGGTMAVDIALNNCIPVTGFVVLCPGGIPEGVTKNTATEAVQRGLRGTIITGVNDPSLPGQRKLVRILKKVGLPHQFIVLSTEHWFPDDVPEQIDAALGHITER